MRSALPVPTAVLRDRPDVTVARVGLGLTVYLDDPERWAREGALVALRSFLACAPRDRLGWFTTSAMAAWEPLTDAALGRIIAALPLPWERTRLRHAFELRLADVPDAPGYGFRYREVDAPRRLGVGWLQLTFPEAHDPDDLAQLAIELAQTLPLHAAIGGHLGVWNEVEAHPALAALRPWCRRYLGLDVQQPDAMGLALHGALPGTSWLTVLGPALAAAADLGPPWREPVTVLPLQHGTLVRAGARPALGDANTFDLPRAYAEVAHRLAALLPTEPPEFAPWEPGETAARMRRFIEPEAWL
jgi:hypothetical protein